MKLALKQLYNGRRENVPVEVVEFIRALSEQYPPRCIRAGESLEQAHRYAGFSSEIELGKQFLDSK